MSAPDTPALEIEGLVGGYGDTTVIRDVSLRVDRGSVVTLIGPNGAGKTTLLRCASGSVRPSAGRVVLDGDDITKLSPHERAGRGLCHIAEGRAIFPSLTVHDNIVLFAGRTDPADALEQAASIFPVLGERMKSRAATLSGGQQQMLALVPAFVTSPRVVLVDEPSLGVAPVLVDTIFELLGRLAATGVSMLIVEQYVTRALALASHAYVLDRGSLRFGGSSSELQTDAIMASYLGSA